ncbi:hypothetical protein [Actinomadura sp. NBRC 104412]|uniref:hypothetical protein n=1 Tax=Actinomadura sp. NBRC 104412 TaxID=3032203 RepID=UPI002552403E|nr:hypothetical protein [Actinomadura sp. NBRC 104412]
MPLDDALKARMAEPDFWPVYLFDEDVADDAFDDAFDDEEEDLQAQFAVGDGYGLVLTLDFFGYYGLCLVAPGLAEAVQVAWDDQAHFHPHLMRWPELDLLCRAVALHDPSLRHPGPMLALLARFAVLDDHDDVDVMTPLVDAAFHLVRPGRGDGGPRPETRDWYELRDLGGTGLNWTTRPDGHLAVDQPYDLNVRRPLYSTRTPDSDSFPFSEWAGLLERAGRLVTVDDPALREPAVRSALERTVTADGHAHLASLAEALRAAGFRHPVLTRALEDPVSRAEACWAVETLAGLGQGTLVKRWFGRSPLADARSWELSLSLDVEGRPGSLGGVVAAELSGALKEAGLGRAEAGGMVSREDPGGGFVETTSLIDVLVRDDLPRAVALISEVVRRHGALGIARLQHSGAPHEEIPLT